MMYECMALAGVGVSVRQGALPACCGSGHAEASRLGHREPGLVSRRVVRRASSSAKICAGPWSHTGWGTGCVARGVPVQGRRGHTVSRLGGCPYWPSDPCWARSSLGQTNNTQNKIEK